MFVSFQSVGIIGQPIPARCYQEMGTAKQINRLEKVVQNTAISANTSNGLGYTNNNMNVDYLYLENVFSIIH